MSDIENSAVDEESISVSKKNGVGSTENGNSIAALKEKAANTVTTAAATAVTPVTPASNDTEEKMEVEEEPQEKLNGSSSPKKNSGNDHPVMNGGSEEDDDAVDEDDDSKDDHTTTNGDSVVNGGSHRSDGNVSQTVTDDDSIQMATPEPSRRGSPRKAAMSGQIQEFSSSDEYDEDEEVEEIKDEDDDSSDSIMELEAEDPLAGPPPPPSQTEKTKSGPNIVTIDDVKALQLLAASSAKKLQESDKVVLIDTNTILAGKATSGVTITPAKPRVLPLGSGTIGSGVTISHASSKPMSRGVGLPMGTTMTSLGSGSSNSALSATQNSGFTYDKQGQLNDPNLTDDTFVVEAPSFIVPYVYEKPPKETFSAFKASIETLTKNLKKKVDITDDDNEKDEKENDKSSEPVPEVKKPSGETFFDSHLGNFVINLGMNLVQEHVQTDLLREQTKKSQKDKSASVMHAIMSLKKNLEASKDKNDGFHFDLRKCRYCSFRTESILVLESHYETPHMKNGMLRCNYCHFETKAPQEILAHMLTKHGVRGKLERAIAAHQCPQCPFEDGMRGKLTRHKVGCDKRFRGDRNQEPPHDWEPPAKIPKPSPFNRSGRPNMMVGAGTNPNYHSMTGGIGLGGLTASHHSAVRMGAGGAFPSQRGPGYPGMSSLQFGSRGRGRPVGTYKPGQPGFSQGFRQISPGVGSMGVGRQVVGGSVLNNQVVLQTANNQGSRYGSSATSPAAAALLNNLGANSSVTIQSISQRNNNPRPGQPSISITPLPGRGGIAGHSSARPQSSAAQPSQALKPGQPTGQGKSGFVICEICDGYIKDLEQLRNHMQWIHKVKIHPKMIYNRPPLNCQKCQFRFFTDQGLERHLLGSHGLVTASMQDLANKGQDSGRCPVCGKVYQWKLLNHVSKDHAKTLKPAHLSYKCTVCTATFGQYKLFENHVYTAHSGGNKKAGEKGGRATPQQQPSSSAASKIASLKMSDEITIIPQGKLAAMALAGSKATLTPTSSKKISDIDSMKKRIGTPSTTKTAASSSSPKKKDVTAESDQDVIELDDEEEADDNEEIDDVEDASEQQQRSPAKRPGKSFETSSGDVPSEAKKAKASATTSEDDDENAGGDSEEEGGVEEINDEDE